MNFYSISFYFIENPHSMYFCRYGCVCDHRANSEGRPMKNLEMELANQSSATPVQYVYYVLCTMHQNNKDSHKKKE